MNRNRLLAGLAVLFAAFGQAQAKPSPPNIVLIVADDLGYGQLGSYGQKQIRTPHLDRLAAEGTRFTQFYAGHCVCAPSRCVLMTGYHTGHCSTRVNGGGAPLLDSDITLAEVLKGAGYATGCFGKWGLGDHGTAARAVFTRAASGCRCWFVGRAGCRPGRPTTWPGRFGTCCRRWPSWPTPSRPQALTARPWPSGCWAKNKRHRNGSCIGKPSHKTKAANRRGPSRPVAETGRRSGKSPICHWNFTTSASISAKRATWSKAHPEVVKQFEAFLKTARTTSRTYPVEEPLWKYEPLKTGFVR